MTKQFSQRDSGHGAWTNAPKRKAKSENGLNITPHSCCWEGWWRAAPFSSPNHLDQMNTPPTQRLSPNQNHVKTCLIIVIWYILTATSSISLKQALSSRIITPLWASILVSIPPSLMWFLSPSIRRRASSSDSIPTRVLAFWE